MQRLRILIAVAAMLAAAGSAFLAQDAPQGRIEPGAAVPPLALTLLDPEVPEGKPLALSEHLGKRPLVICYFVMGEAVSEEVLLSLQEALADGMEGEIQPLAAMRIGQRITHGEVVDRLSLLGISMPVVLDQDLTLARVLGVTTAPSLHVIDHRGHLRIADAKSLKQKVATGMDLDQAIRNAARRGPVPTVTKLPRYYPANELVDQAFPDFALKKFRTNETLRLSDLVRKDQVTALMFWHPNCKHCKRAMPGVVVGQQSYEKWLNVVSVVDLTNADEVRNCEDTIRAHGIPFPVLEDEGRRITDLYKVISTPTMFFIRPDGVVDSVYTTGEANYVPIFSLKIRRILKVGREYDPNFTPG